MFIDLTGMKFNKLTVQSKSDFKKHSNIYWNCICDCGNFHLIDSHSLKSGHTKSCGCFKKEMAGIQRKTHGHSKTKIYMLWGKMIERCTKKNSKDYKYYGARGITVCDEWMDFNVFLNDMGHPCRGMSLDRKDNNQGYSKENCKWSTREEQTNNMRSNILIKIPETTMTMAQFSIFINSNYDSLRGKIDRGMNVFGGVKIEISKRGIE